MADALASGASRSAAGPPPLPQQHRRSADVFDPAGGQVRALGHVDTQNRYGAVIRSTFSCTVTQLGGTRWRLDRLTLNER